MLAGGWRSFVSVTNRSCGSCTACCYGLGIEEIDKPTFQNCAYLCGNGAGCGVYSVRPHSCRDYQCLWLQGHLTERDRPDKLGVIFTTTQHPTLGSIPMLVEVRPAALDRPLVRRAIDQLAAHRPVLLSSAKGRRMIEPRSNAAMSPGSLQTVPLTVTAGA